MSGLSASFFKAASLHTNAIHSFKYIKLTQGWLFAELDLIWDGQEALLVTDGKRQRNFLG